MPEIIKDAAEGAQKAVLQFSKNNAMKVVTDQLLEQYADRPEGFKTALKEVFETLDPPETALDLPNVRKVAVNKRKVLLGEVPLIQANAIENAWNGLSETVREKALAAHAIEQEKRKADTATVFKEIIEKRLGSDILEEVKRGDEYSSAILKGNLIWLIKRIRKVKSLGVTFESSKTWDHLQKLKQGSKSCSAHLLAFSNGVSEMIRAGGWTKTELDNVASPQANLVKNTLLESLSLKSDQSIMAAAIVAIRNDSTLTFDQMSTKLIEAEASQAGVDEKTGAAPSKKKALATKKDETSEEKNGDDKTDKQQPWKARGARGKGGRGGGRGDNSGRGGRGDGDNNSRNDGRGGGGRGGNGRGGGGRGGGGRGRGGRGFTLATGPGTFKRSKQNLIRYQYVKDLVKDRTIDIVWVPTENMIADILTKVLVGSHFRSQVEGLGVV